MEIFEDIYNKYLKIKKEEPTIESKKINMTQEQQINYLKSLGKQSYGYEKYKVDSYSKKINKINYGVYIVRLPIIEEPILDNDYNIIEQPINFCYKTCIVAINENDLVIDDILSFKNADIELVKDKYYELCNILEKSEEREILELINSEISRKI